MTKQIYPPKSTNNEQYDGNYGVFTSEEGKIIHTVNGDQIKLDLINKSESDVQFPNDFFNPKVVEVIEQLIPELDLDELYRVLGDLNREIRKRVNSPNGVND